MKRKEEYCPICKSSSLIIKEYRTRKLKHALFLHKPTTFLLKERRFKCRECGKTFTESNCFAFRRNRLTKQTIREILFGLMEWNSTNKTVGKNCHVSETTVQNIFDTYVNFDRKTLPEAICIDECYNCSLFDDPYSCILLDFKEKKVIDIIQDRSKLNLVKYFNVISLEERQNVKYVVIDMWEPYLDIAKMFFPNAIVAIDSFHVLQNMSRALDNVRKRIMRRYEPGTNEYYLFKNQSDLLFEKMEQYGEKIKVHKFKRFLNKKDMLDMMLALDNELFDAYQYYHRYKRANHLYGYDAIKSSFNSFSCDPKIAKIKEFVPILSMLQTWEEYILNSFKIIDGRRLSNGPIEGFNSTFKKTIVVSNGYANFNRFRNRVIFCYNKEFKLIPRRREDRIVKLKRPKRGKYNKQKKTTESH